MHSTNRIKLIRKVSFFLFFFALISLVGSLWLNNSLAVFTYSKTANIEGLKPIEGIFYQTKINCSQNLSECSKFVNSPHQNSLKIPKKLGDCFENDSVPSFMHEKGFVVMRSWLFNDMQVSNGLKSEFKNKEIELVVRVKDTKDKTCIKNSKSYKFYKIFPYYYEFLYYLKNHPKTKLGTNVAINPFLNGEVSISNVVKRFPINVFFKTLLLIGTIFMYLYWRNYSSFFKENSIPSKRIFLIFGLSSAIFLFIHVLFLGTEIDNKILKFLRRLIIALFILFEITAQYLLTIDLYKNKKKLIEFCNLSIVNLKLVFIILIGIISIIVIYILLVYDFSRSFDYILEWNYFVSLLFYYFLSFLMWKKKI